MVRHGRADLLSARVVAPLSVVVRQSGQSTLRLIAMISGAVSDSGEPSKVAEPLQWLEAGVPEMGVDLVT